ncbi:hypothetical protein D9M72_386830 [compost metagenome]
MPEHRHVACDADLHQGANQHHLAGRGGEQVLTAQYVGDPHQGVIHRVHQGVQRRTVGADDHVVRDAPGLKGDFAADHVGESDVLVWHADSEDRFAALGLERGNLLGAEVAVEVVVAELGVAAGGTVARFNFLRRGVALVGVAGLQQLGHHVLVEVKTL